MIIRNHPPLLVYFVSYLSQGDSTYCTMFVQCESEAMAIHMGKTLFHPYYVMGTRSIQTKRTEHEYTKTSLIRCFNKHPDERGYTDFEINNVPMMRKRSFASFLTREEKIELLLLQDTPSPESDGKKIFRPPSLTLHLTTNES